MFGFIMNVYKDEQFATSLIRQLRSLYPRATIVIQTDGVDPEGLQLYCQRYDAFYIVGERLKSGRKNGGAWVHRWMQTLFNLSDAPWLIKIDPDAWMWRKLIGFPPDADVVGTPNLTPYGMLFIRGGFQIWKSSAISQILQSDILFDPQYTQFGLYTYRRYKDFLLDGEEESLEVIALTDHILGHVCARLRLRQAMWSEVNIGFRGQQYEHNPGLRWAVTHPTRNQETRNGLGVITTPN